MSISAAQCRAGRALLDWTQDTLAKNAHVSRATIADFERNLRMPIKNNLISIAYAMEAAGIAFIEGDEQGAGVRFRVVKLEYTKNLRPVEGGLCLSVRYEGKGFSVIIPDDVIDDIDQANYYTRKMQEQAVSNHLPLYLRVAEEEIRARRISDNNCIVLAHGKFPPGTFE